jgi:hypothetical protein
MTPRQHATLRAATFSAHTFRRRLAQLKLAQLATDSPLITCPSCNGTGIEDEAATSNPYVTLAIRCRDCDGEGAI